MPISPEEREQVANELKKFATDLNLSSDQKEKLHGFLTEAYEKVQDYKKQNPNATREDLVRKVAENRTAIRERLTKFLSPEQLGKWDAEVAKAKDFLGQRMAASAQSHPSAAAYNRPLALYRRRQADRDRRVTSVGAR